MAIIKPFKALRPGKEYVQHVSAPSDSGNYEASLAIIQENPHSFLHVVKPHLHFDTVKKNPAVHYPLGRIYLEQMVSNGVLVKDDQPAYYIYRTIKGSRAYTGIIAAAAIADYLNNVILKHENTRTDKQNELLEHVKYMRCIGSPVLITYPDDEALNKLLHDVAMRTPEYNFLSDDQVKHNLWLVTDAKEVALIEDKFGVMEELYIADGHHRSAGSAAYSAYRKGKENGAEGIWDYMPVCLIPFSGMDIYEYHRLVKDSSVYKPEFMEKIKEFFHVHFVGHLPFQPLEKGEFGIYFDQKAYRLELKEELKQNDILESLDVSVVEKYILKNIFNIIDSKTDPRLSFMDGSKGIGTLQHHVDRHKTDLAITLFPTSIQEVIAVAKNNLIMPPKSTWIEPKIRTGLVVYEIG
jgi:uncharacterized protein (DUF1015 family)